MGVRVPPLPNGDNMSFKIEEISSTEKKALFDIEKDEVAKTYLSVVKLFPKRLNCLRTIAILARLARDLSFQAQWGIMPE